MFSSAIIELVSASGSVVCVGRVLGICPKTLWSLPRNLAREVLLPLPHFSPHTLEFCGNIVCSYLFLPRGFPSCCVAEPMPFFIAMHIYSSFLLLLFSFYLCLFSWISCVLFLAPHPLLPLTPWAYRSSLSKFFLGCCSYYYYFPLSDHPRR